jgi:hypothetical protein
MLPVPNVLLDCVIWCNFTDFNPKQIKSKIDKYKINNNNTSTKHEFKVKYEGYLGSQLFPRDTCIFIIEINTLRKDKSSI